MISLEVFINGENINLCKPDKDFALNSDWYNWFNDPKNTKFLEQGIKKNTREDQLKFFLSIKNRLLLIIEWFKPICSVNARVGSQKKSILLTFIFLIQAFIQNASLVLKT